MDLAVMKGLKINHSDILEISTSDTDRWIGIDSATGSMACRGMIRLLVHQKSSFDLSMGCGLHETADNQPLSSWAKAEAHDEHEM